MRREHGGTPRVHPRPGAWTSHNRLTSRGQEVVAIFTAIFVIVTVFPVLSMSGKISVWLGNPSEPAHCGGEHIGRGTSSLWFVERNQVYNQIQADFEKNGPLFLAKGKTSQSLKVSDIFKVKDGIVEPLLKAAKPPVRANVLYFDPKFAQSISQTVQKVINQNFTGGVWHQDPQMYHASLFHASHHLDVVVASAQQVDEEAAAVKGVCQSSCPLVVALDRVVLTTTGVLLACWQVLEGTDPAILREKLRHALPRSPTKQLYNRAMLHTSLARILVPPNLPSGEVAATPVAAMPVLKEMVERLNQNLCRVQATLRELWYVEEMDVLALALNGSTQIRKYPLACVRPKVAKHIAVPG